MFRLLYITSLLIKYFFLYLLLKIKFISLPKEKLVRNFFEEAGGSFIKFGQLLSLRADVFPKEYIVELLDLLDNVLPFSYKEVENIFLYELGTVPNKIFKQFEKTPFASASFGQVHAAKLLNNDIVAVKILRPGIEQQVQADFLVIDVLAILAEIFVKIEVVPWREFANEFKKWTLKELDYRIEAEHMTLMYNFNKEDRNVIIPKLYPRYSTKSILVQEYIDGIPLSRILRGLRDGRLNAKKLLKMGVDIKKIPHVMAFTLMKQCLIYETFHADPHPGNILILPNNKIGLVDFGILGKMIKKRLFIEFSIHGAYWRFKEAAYYFSQLAGDELKQLLLSAFPAHIDQERIDSLIKLLSDHFVDLSNQTIKQGVEDLKTMRIDYTVMFLQLLRNASSYKIKVPKEMAVYLRALSIISFLSKELNNDFLITEEIKYFFNKYPKDTLLKDDYKDHFDSYKRLNREKALEKLNNWLAFLFEKNPQLYELVNNYIQKNKLVTA